MTDDLPVVRKSHPYVMYDMMRDTPNGIKSTIEKVKNFDPSHLTSPLYFTGNGTAYHSAVIGAQILHSTNREWHTIQAYELENYGKPAGTVIGVSHTGKTKSTVDALKKASATASTIGITHYEGSPLTMVSKNSLVIGNSPDLSLCNTKTFFDNVFAVMKLASLYGNIHVDLGELAGKVEKAIESLDSVMEGIAGELKDVDDIFVLGAGPNFTAAREAAQKIKEATHIHTEGIELEEFNHGCTAVIDDKSLVIIIETPTVMERSRDIVRACREVGTRTLVINGQGDYTVRTPAVEDEYLSPVVNMVPLYYLAYYLAVVKGINPDYLRFEEEAYLKYDQIVFPPGAH